MNNLCTYLDTESLQKSKNTFIWVKLHTFKGPELKRAVVYLALYKSENTSKWVKFILFSGFIKKSLF